MNKCLGILIGSLLAALLVAPQRGFSAPLPKSTQQILKKLKVDYSILDGLDKELKVPQGWIEKAKVEGRVSVRGTPARSR